MDKFLDKPCQVIIETAPTNIKLFYLHG